ncbi:MAG: glycosyltransferase [Ardenticatenaceae bacterium]|nr:glycosyltransferase [Ardenticatenaceae bacterium]
MKIGIIAPGFSADKLDWCIPALLDLVRVLAGRAEVHVFALRYPHRGGRYTVYGAQVHAFGAGEGRGVRTVRLWAGVLAALAAEHRYGRFDRLHAFWADEPGLLGVLAARHLGVPAILSLAGGELARLPEIGYGGQLRRSERWKTRLALRWARTVTAGSRFLVDAACSHLPPAHHVKLFWAPLGVDLNLFPPRASPPRPAPGRLHLVNVASLLPVKDHALLFEALRRVRTGGLAATLTLVGEGPLEDDLRRRAAATGLAEAVTFRGPVRREQLAALLRTADVFALSSRHEAQCLAALEAAASGLPVAGTAVGVVPELAPTAAIATPPGDPDALAGALGRLADEATRTAMGHAARQRVETEFGLERCVERFWRLYHA